MCRALLSLLSLPVTPHFSPVLQRKLLKKLFKVTLTQDLERHSGLAKRGIDLMELMKITELPGLLPTQLFHSFDLDNDGIIGENDFIESIFSLYTGSDFQRFQIFFNILDFNQKGFITNADLRAILMSLPRVCSVCSQEIVYSWRENDVFVSLFGEIGAHSLQSLYENRVILHDILKDVLNTISMSLPKLIFPIIGLEKHEIPCNSDCEMLWTPLSHMNSNLDVLMYESRSYYCVIWEECMLLYASLNAEIPKKVVFMKGLFVVPVGKRKFEMRNGVVGYEFKANTEEMREKWVEEIMKGKKFRWIDDFYEVGERIGEGAQGNVYLGSSRGSTHSVAIKIIDKSLLTPTHEERLRREISTLKTLKHPNVMKLYDVFETAERVYIVSEAYRDGTLYDYLIRQSFKVEEEFVKAIVREVTAGLMYLHSHNVIHRDIKLENVMLRRTSTNHFQPVLIDFGFSSFLGPDQTSTEPIGTLKYTSPEVLSRLPYSFKSDFWSFGVLLYILLVGKMPFYGKNDQEIAIRILKKQVHLNSETWLGVSAEAKAVVTGLLTKNAESRWGGREILQSKWLSEENKAK